MIIMINPPCQCVDNWGALFIFFVVTCQTHASTFLQSDDEDDEDDDDDDDDELSDPCLHFCAI